MATDVSANADLSRYEIRVDGELAGFTEFVLRDGVAVFPHTQVEEKFAGQGLAKRLIGAALDDMRAKNLKVIARCPFVKSFIEKNADYQDLLA